MTGPRDTERNRIMSEELEIEIHDEHITISRYDPYEFSTDLICLNKEESIRVANTIRERYPDE